jgi:hypothetical protein
MHTRWSAVPVRSFATALLMTAALAACSSTSSGGDASDTGGALETGTADATGIDALAPGDGSSDGAIARDAPAAAGDGGFACGDLTCDAATQYCQVLAGGTLPDGGRQSSYRCDEFNIVCTTDHTCACLQRNLKCSNSCTEPMGQVTTVCGTP